MIDHQINASICKVQCGEEAGTGWLISETTVVTARHCIRQAIDSETPIELDFSERDAPLRMYAQIKAYHNELDFCLLSISEPTGSEPIQFAAEAPREGNQWHSFGYPAQKAEIGHRISGKVEHILSSPKMGMDVDLSVDHASTLTAYKGLSGAPVIVGGICTGILKLKVGQGVGAISLSSVLEFLGEWGLTPKSPTSESKYNVTSRALAERDGFQTTFEERVETSKGGYLFMEGAHGIGKTTFCARFRPLNPKLITLGSYQLSAKGRGATPVIRAQPEVFFDWLSTGISVLLTGHPSRKEDLTYVQMSDATARLLQAFSDHCDQNSQHGVFFLDGINEGASADAAALQKLLGLLPQSLPLNITIVFTAPNYHNVADVVSAHVAPKNIVKLPLLSEQSCRCYCQQQLEEQLISIPLLNQIWDKSQGHPLYLRYIIEFVNANNHQSLDEFPTLAGPIEDYYESVWVRLLQDDDAVNLLGIIARLRWGINPNDLLPLMSAGERSAFVPTLTRIHHLLMSKESTEVYHASFAEFICRKTSSLEQSTHQRLAEWCIKEAEKDYCKLNVLFHCLRAGDALAKTGVTICQQKWVDDCVILGVEPDVLMSDVARTLSIALRSELGAEAIRLLLLQQRINFRYNVLFAQSAHLTAHALIALHRPDEAMKFAIRFDTLIVSPRDAMHIAYRLAEKGYIDHALDILGRLNDRLVERYSDAESYSISEFVELSRLLIQVNMYAGIASGTARAEVIARVLRTSLDALEQSLGGVPSKEVDGTFARIQSTLPGLQFYLQGIYTTIAQLQKKIRTTELPPAYLLTLFGGLLEYSDLVEELGPPRKIPDFEGLFADLATLIAGEVTLRESLLPAALDTLLEFHAPLELVRAFASKVDELAPGEIELTEENGVDVAHEKLKLSLAEWRVKYFLDDSLECTVIQNIGPQSWKRSFEQILRATAWFEGRAKRAIVDKNTGELEATYKLFSESVLPHLKFSLAERTTWNRSYAIPEGLALYIWPRIAIVLRDAYSSKLPSFIEDLVAHSAPQLGLYTEGYRRCMSRVVNALIDTSDNEAIQDALFTLLDKWKNHVVTFVENRHELVPELLELIPLFVKMEAQEQADQLYKHVLNVSMGPTWYKEDQFNLMTTALRKLELSDPLDGQLSQIAGYLHRASGEMTFQRYVRYEKAELLGALIRRNAFAQSVRYYMRQTCGSQTELLGDQRTGELDRINATKGLRFPGDALDEQEAILHIVRSADSADWKLRWALLEIFQCGDHRHLHSYAFEYASVISQAPADEIDALFKLLDGVIGAEISADDRADFFSHLASALSGKFSEKQKALHAKYDVKGIVASHEPTKSNDEPNELLETADDMEDKFFLPGTFGKKSATRAAQSRIESATKSAKRGNVESAMGEAVQALKTLQDGGWSIWNDLAGETVRAAESLLAEHEPNANAAIRRYRELIEDEQYEDKYRVASHLIKQFGRTFPASDRLLVLGHVLEHVHLMVGDSSNEANLFVFLDDEQGGTADSALFDFILWLTDHPKFIRRTNAARILLRLVNIESKYLRKVIQTAFSNTVSYAGDISCGLLDMLSARDPISTWERISAAIDISIAQECVHVGRIAVMSRIANRAAAKGNQSAIDASALIKARLRHSEDKLSGKRESYSLPIWAECVAQEWHKLKSLGMCSQEVAVQWEAELRSICHPLSIADAKTLEMDVSNAFREPEGRPLNRWEGKVRSALARALMPFASHVNLQNLEAALRPYNPNAPEGSMQSGLKMRGDAMVEAITSTRDFRQVIGTSGQFYLNYFESLLTPESEFGRPHRRMIEVLAILLPHPNLLGKAIEAAIECTCDSLSYPDFSQVFDLGPTCLRIDPSFAYFGSFTPAFPLTSFLANVGATTRDVTRVSWRNGRSYTVEHSGMAESEGCYLAVSRYALRIPSGMKLAWLVKLDGEFVALVDENNHQLG